jgi:hypothetical protein
MLYLSEAQMPRWVIPARRESFQYHASERPLPYSSIRSPIKQSFLYCQE